MPIEAIAFAHMNLLRVHSSEFGRRLQGDDPDSADEFKRGVEAAIEGLRACGAVGDRYLLSLLDSPDPWTRYAAASNSLAIDEVRAKPVLVALLSQPDPLDLAATVVLQAWITLQVDPRTAD